MSSTFPTVSVTIFAIPKPFTDANTSRIQANAIGSWQHLDHGIDVILFGDDAGVQQFAERSGMQWGGGLRRNELGTPLINDAFAKAVASSSSTILVYCNSDVILRGPVASTLSRIVADVRFPRFLAFGNRTDIQLDRELDWAKATDTETHLQQLSKTGRTAPVVCKEYFAFTRNLFDSIPAFAVGRGNWDNWLVAQTRAKGVPVINLSHTIQALHQQHDYSHLSISRLACYATGVEAKSNQRLAKGRHLIRGSVADWLFDGDQVIPNPGAGWNASFWYDLPRFLSFAARLPFQR